MKKTDSQPTEDCSNCMQKDTLLHKYEQLIHLYKKKQFKHSTGSLSQNIHVLSSQNSQVQPEYTKIWHLTNLLQSVVKKRQIILFDVYKQRSSKKFALLSLTNIFKKSYQQWGFEKISQFLPIASENQIEKSDQQTNVTDEIKIISGWQQYRDCQGESLISSESRVRFIRHGLEEINHKMGKNNEIGLKKVKKFMEIEVINKRLSAEVKYLKKCLEESNRRQQRQNQKKKDSLQMLAQQLCQKNQIINEIQRTLRAYESKYCQNNNVLEEDSIELRKQVDRLQIVRDKLNDELFSLRERLSATKEQLKQKTKQIEKLQNKNKELVNFKLNNEDKQKHLSLLNNNFEKLIKIISGKLKRLSIHEKQSGAACRKSECARDQIKTQIVLSFLANINLKDYELKCQNLFDSEEKQFLAQHKQKFLQLTEEANFINKSCLLEESPQVGLIKNSDNDFNSSIFSIIQNNKESKNKERQCLSDRQGVTMKIIELELEKAKQVQKISALKQKFMHIRVLIINLLKSLEIQENGLRPETEGVLRVIFDMFEYSEEERVGMFLKKKRLFGLI